MKLINVFIIEALLGVLENRRMRAYTSGQGYRNFEIQIGPLDR